MRQYGKLRYVSNNTMITPVVVSVSIRSDVHLRPLSPAAISPLSFALLASIPRPAPPRRRRRRRRCRCRPLSLSLAPSHQDNPPVGVARASAFSVTRKSIRNRASRLLNFTDEVYVSVDVSTAASAGCQLSSIILGFRASFVQVWSILTKIFLFQYSWACILMGLTIGTSFENFFQVLEERREFWKWRNCNPIEMNSAIVVSRRGLESIHRRRHRENPLNETRGSSAK